MVKDKYHIPKISSNQKGSGQLWAQKAQELWINEWSQDPVSRETWLTFQSKSLNLRKRRKGGINFPYVSLLPEESRTILKPAELCLWFRKGKADPWGRCYCSILRKSHGHPKVNHPGQSATFNTGATVHQQKDHSSLRERVMTGISKVWAFFQTQCCGTLNRPQYISKHSFYMY